MPKRTYDSNFKLKVVLETLNPNTTLEQVRRKYNLSNNAVNSWRRQFYEHAHAAFEVKRNSNPDPKNSVDELKKIIGDLTIENSILKKVSNYLD